LAQRANRGKAEQNQNCCGVTDFALWSHLGFAVGATSHEFDRITPRGKLTRRAQSPSMRRPVDVKAHFHLLLSVNQFPSSQAASVAILPSALFGERYSLGAWWVFLFQ
jgi:hypothetical protein